MNAHKGLFQGADVAGDLADPKPTSVGPVQCGTRVSGDRGCSCVADQGARSVMAIREEPVSERIVEQRADVIV